MTARLGGVDVARGVATILMIQTHAYDAWVTPAEKSGVAYGITRALGSLPLVSFLFLAGLSIALRARTVWERGETLTAWPVVRRGLIVLAGGYALSAVSGLIDGALRPEALLRADVLHVIGLSIVLMGAAGLPIASAPDRAGRSNTDRFVVAACVLAIVPLAICPWATRAAQDTQGIMRFVVAPWAEVPGVTRMPVVPLAAWLGLGALAGLRWPSLDRVRLVAVLTIAMVMAFAANWATGKMTSASGEPLSRASLAIWPNAIDFAARALALLALASLVTPRLPRFVRAVLCRFGSGSLFVYVVHLPFCYGRPGAWLRARLSMSEASLGVVLLTVGCGLALVAFESASRWRSQSRRPC